MEYFDIFTLFDDYLYLICDDVSKAFGVKKICYTHKIEVSFICLKDN